MASTPDSSSLGPPQQDSSPVFFSKTCQNCFMLKIRCDRTQRHDICDRCARLGKTCVFRPARRRDNSAKRDSRIQALEQQVQDLLRSQRSGPVVQQSLPEGGASIASSGSSFSLYDVSQNGDVVDEDIVTAERADTLVELYKSDMMPHFPYVYLAPHVNGRMLRYDKPFLFVGVLSVACYHDPITQEKLVNKFKHLVSEKVFLGGDDVLSLEYLQGLLVVLAWNHFHAQSKFFSQYLQLAVSIAVDMRYDRKPIHAQSTNVSSKRNPLFEPESQWGSEEQRATAGLFYLSSTISRLFDKANTFSFTQAIEDGCLALKARSECQTDRELHHAIRLQRIIETIDMLANPSFSDEEAQEAFMQTRAELERFGAQLISEIGNKGFLIVQYHTARLFLYQVAFFERPLQKGSRPYLNTLREGLESTKTFIDLYICLPTKSEMNHLTNAEWVQLSFGMSLAAKFAIASQDPAVEPQTRDLRLRLNIDIAFRQLCLQIGALASRSEGESKQRDIFTFFEQRVRKLQVWYERISRACSTGTFSEQDMHNEVFGRGLRGQSQPTTQPHMAQTASQSTQNYSLQHSPEYSSGLISTSAMPTQGMVSAAPTHYATAYSNAPTIAFPTQASGWDTQFGTPPLEDSSWLFASDTQYHVAQMGNQSNERNWDHHHPR